MGMTIDSQYEIYPCPFCGYRGLLYRIGSGYVIRCENRACPGLVRVRFANFDTSFLKIGTKKLL